MAPQAMAHRSKAATLLAVLSVAAIFLAGPVAAAGKTGQVSVFWGRNKAEGSLREACDAGTYTMVIISFLDVFGPRGYHLDISGHDVSAMNADIKHCQFKGVPVSLSLGGFGNSYSLPSSKAALDLFDYLWNTYFGGSKPGVHRPFGDAWLDGIDLFLEHGSPNDRYDVLALELAKHNIRGGPGKPLHLSATVRCGFAGARHRHLRARPRQDLRERPGRQEVQRVRRVAGRVGQVDGGVPSHQVLHRAHGGGQVLPVGAPQERLLRRHAGGAEEGELRWCHALGQIFRQAEQLQHLHQVLCLVISAQWCSCVRIKRVRPVCVQWCHVRIK